MKKYILKQTKGFTLNEILSQIEDGARFITYGYCISILALTFRPVSIPYFIKKGEKRNKYQLKYNILTLLFGWWGIPWGPIYSVDMMIINKKGGVDVSESVISKIIMQFEDANFDKVLDDDLSITFYDEELTS